MMMMTMANHQHHHPICELQPLRRRCGLGFTRYLFSLKLFVHESIIRVLPPNCIAHIVGILLHDHCALYDPPPPTPSPLLFAIHHTIQRNRLAWPHRRRGLASDGVGYADARSSVGRRFRSVTKLRSAWYGGSFLIAAAALKTPTRNGYNAQGVNLTYRVKGKLQHARRMRERAESTGK